MPTSEARIRANQANAAKSTGPRTPEGKERSRANGQTHGMTGAGVVVPEDDRAAVDRLAATLLQEMAPKTTLGAQLVLTMARLSVRMERASRHESAAVAIRVRHASEAFEEERFDLAARLLEGLGDDPAGNLRRLRAMPEGVDRLVEAWGDLRADLARPGRPTWTPAHLERAAHLIGLRVESTWRHRVGVLAMAALGDFSGLADREGGPLDDAGRRAWARDRLVERIDAEVAALEIHRDSIDREVIERDRLNAPERALFDPSREAALARRYEAEAQRGFFRALDEYRRVEAEAAAQAESEAVATRPEVPPRRPHAPPAPPAGPLASSWVAPEPLPGESFEAYRERATRLDRAARQADGRPSPAGGAL